MPSVLFLLGSYGNLDWPASESQATTLPSQTPVQSSIPQPVPGQSPITYGQSQMNVQPNQTLPQRPGIPTPPTSHLNPLNQVCKLIILPLFLKEATIVLKLHRKQLIFINVFLFKKGKKKTGSSRLLKTGKTQGI